MVERIIAVIERIRTAIETSQQSIDVVLSWKRFTRGITNDFADAIEKAWTRKVNVRFLIGGNADTETAKQLIGFCKEKPCCQTRFCSKYPEAILGIYDKKELFVIAKAKTNLSGSAALWTINPSLVSIAKHYFEMLWRTAIEMN